MRRILSGLLICLLLAACTVGIVRQEELGSVAPATSTPSPAPTDTLRPTPTPLSVPTDTLRPTDTPQPTDTLQPSPTPPPMPSDTPTSEPAVTPVPAPTPTGQISSGPVIHYFRADVEEADPGDTIVLEWRSEGATSAVLYHLLPSGQFSSQFWEVDTVGAFAYEIDPGERNHTTFYLYVVDELASSADAMLTVSLRCPDTWFFSPAPDECPWPAVHSAGAEQHFERGTMIWIEEEDRIYVLYGDDQYSPRWQIYTDAWDEGDPERDPTLAPPPGLQQPVRGFGLIWRQYPDVRLRLGWAVDQETGFTTAVQRTTRYKYNSTYVHALDGSVWHLQPEGSGWEKILTLSGE